MCLTRHDDGHLSQAPCAHLSSQIFYYDNQTAHLGPSSSPDPTPTSCLEATGVGPGPGPQPAKLSAWGGSQSGPLALFDASAATIVLSPLTEHMSSVMNAGPDGSAAIAVGVGGGVESVPAGHSLETVLFSGSGIRDSYEQWGDALLQFHGKTRTRFDHDVFARAQAAEERSPAPHIDPPLPASPFPLSRPAPLPHGTAGSRGVRALNRTPPSPPRCRIWATARLPTTSTIRATAATTGLVSVPPRSRPTRRRLI